MKFIVQRIWRNVDMTKFEYLDIAQLALPSIINPRDHLRAAYLDCFQYLTRELQMKIHMAALNDASDIRC